MIIWIVTERDYDASWIVAAYPTEALATEHVTLMGGIAESVEVRTGLHPDATNPVKQKERADENEKSRQEFERNQQHWKDRAQAVEACRPAPPHMSLCHCETFTSRTSTSGIKWTDHGYCSYCGGWSPPVFRKYMGEPALQDKINELDIWRREKMRAIVASVPA